MKNKSLKLTLGLVLGAVFFVSSFANAQDGTTNVSVTNSSELETLLKDQTKSDWWAVISSRWALIGPNVTAN
jgi:hypothetical protein